MNVKLVLAFAPALLAAQAPPPANFFYQQVGPIAGAGANVMYFKTVESVDGQPVAGKPVSATRETHSLQILTDGTRIENTNSEQFYRDEQGRTRVEHNDPSGPLNAVIHDPVAGSTVLLEPAAKIARKLPSPATVVKLPPPDGQGHAVHVEQRIAIAGPGAPGIGVAGMAGGPNFNV